MKTPLRNFEYDFARAKGSDAEQSEHECSECSSLQQSQRSEYPSDGVQPCAPRATGNGEIRVHPEMEATVTSTAVAQNHGVTNRGPPESIAEGWGQCTVLNSTSVC